MIPAPFRYLRAESASHAVELLGAHGEDAKLLAGGQSLLPILKLRLARPGVLIDISRLAELSYIRVEDDVVAIGAATRHCDVVASDVLAREAPLLSHVAAYVGDRQIRHRGTFGGSLVHGDPAADLPAAVLALGATFVVQGPSGQRRIDAYLYAGLQSLDEQHNGVCEWPDPHANRHGRCAAGAGAAGGAGGDDEIGVAVEHSPGCGERHRPAAIGEPDRPKRAAGDSGGDLRQRRGAYGIGGLDENADGHALGHCACGGQRRGNGCLLRAA